MIDEGSLREEFSDTTLLKGDRVMSGSYLGYTLSINEVVTRQDIAEIQEFQIDVQQQKLTDDNLSTASWPS
jgi:hypothetical protein